MGLFDKVRGNRAADGVVYAFTFKIVSGQTQIPTPMRGAYVVAYALGKTPTEAAERSVTKLRTMGYVVQDMEPKGGEIALARWDEHLAERWPEFANHFPGQHKIVGELEQRHAILSPFAGFE
ncbi:MAG: hypothetical protein ABL889_19115 [Terricaulis sp.]